ncbi:MAG: ZPR1 zinc finger domain-containing protein [Promethearchaeota archaeon]
MSNEKPNSSHPSSSQPSSKDSSFAKPTSSTSSNSSKPKSLQEKIDLKRKNGQYELPPIEKDIRCPVCNKEVEITRTLYSLPDGDEVIIFVILCEHCGYRKADTIPVYTAFKPGKYQLTVDDGDFTSKIFRGATGNLEIPEIGVTIERGPAANFDFTNIEGILLKMEKQIQFFLQTTPADTHEWEQANEALKRLLACKEGSKPFTVILTDFEGGSYISTTNPAKLVFEKAKKKMMDI